MQQTEQIPNEHLSIRSIWLSEIHQCAAAFSSRSKPDMADLGSDYHIGCRIFIDSVDILYHSLIDWGEATIRSDVKAWYKKEYVPGLNKLHEANINERSYFHQESVLSEKLYDYILQTLNKYGMLFPEQTKGYSNVEMVSV